ncbi:hypothetical protein M8J77_014930 [Diaphorina citri]|nr:hypothetical protein M8J77_014930 [Diaphorina citri]
MATLCLQGYWVKVTKEPDFVGSYDIGKYVFFFFRETAVEYINCGKSVFSRVARVCKRDTGGKNILSQNWATYLKARLNCSIPGEFPFYFNEIQDIYKVPGDDTKFYGVFTTSTTGLMGSAICSFSIEDIERAFVGKFKEQATSTSAWLPVLSSRVPEPRPGQCVNDTETLPDSVLNFIRSHPLMDEAVAHRDNKPVFYRRDLLFTHLVVDVVQYEVFGTTSEYIVYFAATNTGRVYKVVQWYDEYDEPHSSLLDIFDVTPNEPVRVMEISRTHRSLYVASDERIKQIALVMCAHRYDNCLRCVRDPYCGWDKDSGTCKPYQVGLLQDVSNTSDSICESSVGRLKQTVTWGQSVHLSCFVKLPASMANQPMSWYHYSKDKGRYQIKFRSDKFIRTVDGGLVIMAVEELDAGKYDCWLGNTVLCTHNLTVDAHRCSPPGQKTEYQKAYALWCHEFQKYKSAMKTWEKKEAQCGRRTNETLTIGGQNTHPNEIFHGSPIV